MMKLAIILSDLALGLAGTVFIQKYLNMEVTL